MIYRELRGAIRIMMLETRHAEAFFEFVEKDRQHFENWIPFVSKTRNFEDARLKIDSYLDMFKEGQGYFWCLWDKAEIIGLVLVKDIDEETRTAEIGYMVAKAHEGRGLVKEACALMIDFIFHELDFAKVVICCDEKNDRSIGIAKRLGFELEGISKDDIVINDITRSTMHWGLYRN